MINIVIGGDICPINRHLHHFNEGDASIIFNDLLEEFREADLTIANLECPLIEDSSPIKKNGPVIGVDSGCVNGIKNAQIDVLNLANNHILDHSEKGLINTLRICSETGLMTVGAGENLQSADRMLIKKIQGLRIGILGVADYEFSIATDNSPGANPLNLINFVRNIRKNKEHIDYLIMLVHSGISNYPFPSPRLMQTCRFMAEMGADAIICQHSHCPGPYEQYEGAFIVYGQGNLIFDLNTKSLSDWNKGFLVKLTIMDRHKHSLKIIPYIQSDSRIGARKMDKREEELFVKQLEEMSAILDQTTLVQQEWLKLCSERRHMYYLYTLLGSSDNKLYKLIYLLNKKFNVIERLYGKKHLLALENMIRCESHREIVETILEEKRNTK